MKHFRNVAFLLSIMAFLWSAPLLAGYEQVSSGGCLAVYSDVVDEEDVATATGTCSLISCQAACAYAWQGNSSCDHGTDTMLGCTDGGCYPSCSHYAGQLTEECDEDEAHIWGECDCHGAI